MVLMFTLDMQEPRRKSTKCSPVSQILYKIDTILEPRLPQIDQFAHVSELRTNFECLIVNI